MILVIDNYDSFVHNLARYLERLGVATHVVRNDAVTVGEISAIQPKAIVLSPGPCTPDEAGCSLEVVRQLHGELPMFGVCLGHQTIAQALGAQVVRGDHPWHGRSSLVTHSATGLFADVPTPLEVGRYHSLVVDPKSLPPELEATAWTENHETVMAMAHHQLPLFGVQFHPESILTEHGYQILENFLHLAGIPASGNAGQLSTSERTQSASVWAMPDRPVTF